MQKYLIKKCSRGYGKAYHDTALYSTHFPDTIIYLLRKNCTYRVTGNVFGREDLKKRGYVQVCKFLNGEVI